LKLAVLLHAYFCHHTGFSHFTTLCTVDKNTQHSLGSHTFSQKLLKLISSSHSCETVVQEGTLRISTAGEIFNQTTRQ